MTLAKTKVTLVVFGFASLLLNLIAAVPDLALKDPNRKDRIGKFGINVFAENEFILKRQSNDKTPVKNSISVPLVKVAEKLWGKHENKLSRFKYFGRRFNGGIAGKVRR